MNSSGGKILVIRGGAIGDFILTLPAIAALRRQFPQAQLEVLGYPHIVQLAVAGGLVDRVQSIEARALAGFFARGGTLEPGLADYFDGFSVIVSYLFDPDEIFKTNVGRCSRAQFIIGPHRPNEAERTHATKVYLKPLERLAIFEADHLPQLLIEPSIAGRADLPSLSQNSTTTRSSPSLPRSGGEGRGEEGLFYWGIPSPQSSPRSFVTGRGRSKRVLRQSLPVGQDARQRVPTVVLHPGSGSERKNWPEARWLELLQHLHDATELNFLLVGGEAEGERLQRLAAALPPARVQVARSLPLAVLARWLQGCAAFVGHDSGISHLAAALGLPGLVLWGDTIEEVWRPPHEAVVVVKSAGGLKMISVPQVAQGLAELLEY
jgi:heptosyltransferase III